MAVTNACRFDCIKHGIEIIEQCLMNSKPKRCFDVLKPCDEHMIVIVIEFACLTFHPQCKFPIIDGVVVARLHHCIDKWYQRAKHIGVAVRRTVDVDAIDPMLVEIRMVHEYRIQPCIKPEFVHKT